MKQLGILIASLCFLALSQNSVYSGDYKLINKTGSSISGIYISSSGSDTWLAIGSTMTSGQNISFTFDAVEQNCQYKIKFTDNKGIENIIESIDMCSVSEIILSSIASTESERLTLPFKKK